MFLAAVFVVVVFLLVCLIVSFLVSVFYRLAVERLQGF